MWKQKEYKKQNLTKLNSRINTAVHCLKTFFLCKSFPLQPFFFFFRTDYTIPQTFTVTSSIGCLYFLVFLFYHF